MQIAVLVPHTGSVRALFAQSLAQLIAHTYSVPIHVDGKRVEPVFQTFFAGEGWLTLKRLRLALAAQQWGADFILWADSDQTFPPDALLALMMHQRPVVACNYPTRASQPRPTAMQANRVPVETTAEKAAAGELEEVVTAGMGLMLMGGPLLARIPKPWFKTVEGDDGAVELGEDTHFCNQARAAGIPIFVDHGLSWRVGHLTELPVTLADVAAGSS